MQDALDQLKTAEAAVEAAVTELNSQLATEDPTWAAIQTALVTAGWTPPAVPDLTPTDVQQ